LHGACSSVEKFDPDEFAHGLLDLRIHFNWIFAPREKKARD
jgi:hypothetical protein